MLHDKWLGISKLSQMALLNQLQNAEVLVNASSNSNAANLTLNINSNLFR